MSGDEDVLGWRAHLARQSAALGLVFDLCAQRLDGPRLLIKAVEVPIADYPKLGVEDYMVSLYNRNTVQRVILAGPAGERLAHEVLGEALAFCRARLSSPA